MLTAQYLRRLPRLIWLLASLLGLVVPAQAQHEWDTWGMGTDTCYRGANATLFAHDRGAGTFIRFDSGGPRLAGSASNATTSAISDAQGRLLFHSNGRYVYDRLGRVMPNGAKLSADKEDQTGQISLSCASAICPVPGNADQYYLFYYRGASSPYLDTMAANPILTYAVVDMRLNGGYGAVVRRDVRLLQTNSFKLVLLRHPNQRDYWLVTTAYPARGYLSYRIDPAGIAATPVTSLAGEAAYANGFVLKASPDGQFLVSEGTLPYDETPGRLRVQHGLYRYDFDGFSGRLSRETLLHEAAPFWQPQRDIRRYNEVADLHFFDGASFSPSGWVLYTVEVLYRLDLLAGPGAAVPYAAAVCQYDLTLPTDETVRRSRRELLLSNYFVDNVLTRYFDAQLTPDSMLWILDRAELPNTPYRDPLCGGPKAVTIIRQPNQLGAACGVAQQAFRLGPRVVLTIQLPNLIVNTLYRPTALLVRVGCGADSVRLWANSQQTGPAGRWDFGEPTSGTANHITDYVGIHRYARAGTYTVRLTYPDGRVLSREVQVPTGAADFTQANVFTPNGDGLNDVFWPVVGGEGLPGAQLRVFSRWGQLVYEVAAPLPHWDGGETVAGEYFYALDFIDCKGQAQRRHGLVTLIR